MATRPRPSESWGEIVQCDLLCIHLTYFSWNPRHTPFVQLVNEMVDMDVKVLRDGLSVADIPPEVAKLAELP